MAMMLGSRAPDSLAMSMCSRVATELAWARTARAVQGHDVMPMTMAKPMMPLSSAMLLFCTETEMRISTIRAGIASTTLVRPMSSSSSQPPT